MSHRTCLLLLLACSVSVAQYLPFLYPLNYLTLANVDDRTAQVNLPARLQFGSRSYNIVHVSSNGLISFGVPDNSFRPELFPYSNRINNELVAVVAPYWDDIDFSGIQLVGSRELRYNLVSNTSLLNQLNTFLASYSGGTFNADWMVWAYWHNVCPFRDSNCASTQSNFFQALLAVQGDVTYSIFTYQCNLIRWTSNIAAVGFSANETFFENHPLSKTRNVTDIDCINATSGWSNVVYRLDSMTEVCTLPCNNGVCVTDSLCRCFEGWKGQFCNEVSCTPDCVRGSCVPTNTCVCDPGWTEGRCRIDIDECIVNPDICDHHCNNTEGSYTCYCDTGYLLHSDNTTCIEINECETDYHGCSHFCTNTNGSYFCSCRDGYSLTGNGECPDINECSLGISGCQQVCNNTNGSYYCECFNGYRLQNNNMTCEDINECIERPMVCPSDKDTCVNTLGSYQCDCITGYHKNESGTCIDTDECVTGTHSCSQVCINTDGSYDCSCYDGFMRRFRYFCIDINECSDSSLNNCSSDQVCQNTMGSFSCSCQPGYDFGSDGVSCEPQSCHEVLQSPLNGVLYCPSDNRTNDTCYFSCDTGYQLVEGTSQRTCQTNGRWSGRSPRCSPQPCPVLMAPQNGYLQLPCPAVYQSQCIVRCFDGYKLNNTNDTTSQVICSLSSSNDTLWSDFEQCEEEDPCDSNPCNGGRCMKVDTRERFVCDCTGTFHDGETCDRPLVTIDPISVVTVPTITPTFITVRARPNRRITFTPVCPDPTEYVLVPCSPFELSSEISSRRMLVYPQNPGSYTITIYSTESLVAPVSFLAVSSDTGTSPLFDKLAEVQPSCCNEHNMLLRCGTFAALLTSSCSWETVNQMRVTNGIVFLMYDSLQIPVSLAGLVMPTSGTLTTTLPDIASTATCAECKLIPLNEIDFSTDTCYEHIPTPEDSRAFVERQSLTKTFLSSIRSSLFPNWFDISITNDTQALNRLSSTDYLAKLLTADTLLSESGCDSLVTTDQSDGNFIVLQHNGPLSLQVENEATILRSPSDYYCIAVHVCSGQSSPVYIGLPDSAQDGIESISFISNYIERGWKFTFKSVALNKQSTATAVLGAKLWDGLSYQEHATRARLLYDTLLNMETSGRYSYEMTAVNFNFSGFVRYKYITDRSEANVALLDGDCTLAVISKVYNSMEIIVLRKLSTGISIYYEETSPSSCTVMRPSSGIAFKLSYVPQQDQPFYLSVLELPFDTRQCSVDVFLSLNGSQDMNGLSFYSDCLDISFDSLLFTDLVHRLYIPMSDETLCVKPVNFTSLFPTAQFGLVIHSSLNSTRLRLNSFIQLLPGYDDTAVSLGFYRHTRQRVGLLHSVEMTMFDSTFLTHAVLRDSQLEFYKSIALFNNEMFTAHLHGLASTSRLWNDITFNMRGWFPMTTGRFVEQIETSVRDEIMRVGTAANMRKEQADEQLAEAVTRLERARRQVNTAKDSFNNASIYLNQTKANLENAKDRLTQAERNITMAREELRNATTAVENVCQLQVCPMECQNATRQRTVFVDIFSDAVGTCDGLCNVTIRRRVAPFSVPTKVWRYVECCWNISVSCPNGGGVCEETRCSFVCKQVNSTRPVFNYAPSVIEVGCKVPCIVNRFNRTVERTESYTDPCGSRVPNAACVAMNGQCSRNRETAFRALEMRRSDLVQPLRERNMARQAVSVGEIRVSQAEGDVQSAEELLTSAKTLYRSTLQYVNVTRVNHQTLVSSIRDDLMLYNLTQQYSREEVFNIVNVTFSVQVSAISNPSTFPITIYYNTHNRSQLPLDYVYRFKTPFSSQRDTLVQDIVDHIRNPSSRRKRVIDDITDNAFNREQFEIRCAQLNSIRNFIENLFNSLNESQRRALETRENLVQVIEYLRSQANTTSISPNSTGNYTSLQLLFNITQEEIDQSRADTDDSILDSVRSSYMSLLSQAESVLGSLDQTLVSQWRTAMESLLQANATVASRSCSGLVDCLLVLNGSLENLLSFAPSTVTANFSSRLPRASRLLLQLATNQSLTLSEALNNLAPVRSIVNEMTSNGYWCSSVPVFISHPVVETSVQVNRRLTLTCEANSTLPVTYQWRKDGVALPDTSSNTLALDNLQVFDEGNYSCEVTNDVGSVQSTNSSVHVFVLPEFFQLPVSVITYIGDGNGAYFTCNATSRPDPGWRWYHRASERDQWREILGEETNELLIREPTTANEGEYICQGYNDFGNVTSDPVSLRLVSVTARVLVYTGEFSMSSTSNVSNSGRDIQSQLEDGVNFGNVTLDEIRVREVLDGSTIIVSFVLIGRNVTRRETGLTPLETIVADLLASRRELDQVRDRLESYLETSTEFGLEYNDLDYGYDSDSFTVGISEIRCPSGQELYSNRFLCSDCLEGQSQVTVEESRFSGGRSITERVPRCSPCPLNTYQDTVGAGSMCKPCPDNHITFTTGAKSLDECIELCAPNYNSSNGLAPCEPCPEGTYQPAAGEMTCLPCLTETDDLVCSNDPCTKARAVGSCNEQHLRFYYNSVRQQCEPFIYSGCNGNQNNFPSLLACSQTCGCPGNESTVQQCVTDPCSTSTCSSAPTAQCVADYCGNCTSRYFYRDREVTDTCSCSDGLQPVSCAPSCLPTCQTPEPDCTTPSLCVPGCGCPNGMVYDQSRQECVAPSSCDTCSLPVNSGPCKGQFPRWFHNSTSGQCELFLYGGCGGNTNLFTSLQQCTQTCGCPDNSPGSMCSSSLCKDSSCPAYDNAVCEVDTCSNCTVQYYVGLQQVTNQCDVCVLPLAVGTCTRNISRWFFNTQSGRCEQFTYGGCDGNGNNFNSLRDCLESCSTTFCDDGVDTVNCFTNPCPITHCPNFANALCVPNYCGECSAHFYNSTGHDVTMMCSNCPAERPAVVCSINPCDHLTCINLPPIDCVLDVCGECKARYYFNNADVTQFCMSCPAEGQVFKSCGGSCQRTCNDILYQRPYVCSERYCVPGCECPTGQVLDESSQRCVYPGQCPCPPCDPVPANCTNVIRLTDDRCNCPLCGDCSVEGQQYQQRANCPRTCSNPHLLCANEGQPGCGCPTGQVIDETNNRCVHITNCPKPDPCTLAPERGPCNSNIKRFFFNATSQRCQEFVYGGCFANENNFFSQHTCEQQCSDCYPVCSPEYCAVNRGATCSLASSRPGSAAGCPGGCAISNCRACYYSYNVLPFPGGTSCPPDDCAISNEGVNERCMMRWGRCVQRSYFSIYQPVPARERTKDNFRCWSHQCTN